MLTPCVVRNHVKAIVMQVVDLAHVAEIVLVIVAELVRVLADVSLIVLGWPLVIPVRVVVLLVIVLLLLELDVLHHVKRMLLLVVPLLLPLPEAAVRTVPEHVSHLTVDPTRVKDTVLLAHVLLHVVHLHVLADVILDVMLLVILLVNLLVILLTVLHLLVKDHVVAHHVLVTVTLLVKPTRVRQLVARAAHPHVVALVSLLVWDHIVKLLVLPVVTLPVIHLVDHLVLIADVLLHVTTVVVLTVDLNLVLHWLLELALAKLRALMTQPIVNLLFGEPTVTLVHG